MTYSAAYLRATAPPPPGAATAVYAATVSRAPASTAAAIGVTLDHADDRGALRHDVVGWPHAGPDLPAVGDRCVVVFDDAGQPHIQSWKRPSWGGP